ncbi:MULTISPECIES: inositol monophosphatase family protein [Bombella]|uniref:Inositol-1-monophosphatase n=1 Tax=Bombella pollinis TaxID=2967337 RepID=A0ABT3WJS9_9PROT|nr:MULTISPECIES: inositol monophosphatase family protein [Bombella]MCX5619231.1 inositol monophosphatase [Bombella pollinis]MUG04705.1 inositol monophosphatase [Bombella sp. ESL0378]
MPNTSAINERFHAAQKIIKDAAQLAKNMQPAPGKPTAELKGHQDYVTEADRAVETFLVKELSALFPDDAFLGEEYGATQSGAFRWVIDPIDGTSNYARGRNRWCISIGLMHHDTPVAGIIEAPTLRESFTARIGQGAFLNGTPIQASKTDKLREAMVEIGWSPYVPEGWYPQKMGALLTEGSMPRSLGSGALALADVACGRSDGYHEYVIFLWDVAAALVLLQEAGACVSPFLKNGGLTQRTPILACAPLIAPSLSKTLGVSLD